MLPAIITSFSQCLVHPVLGARPGRQLDRVHSPQYHPVYGHLDHSWSAYTNFPVVESTNCIEGMILGYFNFEPKQIRAYSQALTEDGQLLKKLSPKEHRFFKHFLEECIRLTADEINQKYEKVYWTELGKM